MAHPDWRVGISPVRVGSAVRGCYSPGWLKLRRNNCVSGVVEVRLWIESGGQIYCRCTDVSWSAGLARSLALVSDSHSEQFRLIVGGTHGTDQTSDLAVGGEGVAQKRRRSGHNERHTTKYFLFSPDRNTPLQN